MILLGIGANLPSPRHGPPRATCEAALAALDGSGIAVGRRSRWYRTAPVPASAQPWYVNAVAALETGLAPDALLHTLLGLEYRFGRVRGGPNAGRVLDLDLLAHGDLVRREAPVLPHPRMAQRAFVLLPLAEVAPGWRHPVSGESVEALIARLPPGQVAIPFDDSEGGPAPRPGATGAGV